MFALIFTDKDALTRSVDEAMLLGSSNDSSYYLLKWSIAERRQAGRDKKKRSTINLGVSHRLVNVVLSLVMGDPYYSPPT